MRFLYNEAALLYRRTLIVGDTHFGIEQRLRERGVRASHISAQLAERLQCLAREHQAKKIIFLGDVKDRIGSVDAITKKIFGELKKEFELIIVRGNHDGGIEELGVHIAPSKGMVYGSLGLIHGHSWPAEAVMKARYVISAHQHPQIALKDRFGKMHLRPAWIVASPAPALYVKYPHAHRNLQFIIIPAFNSLVGHRIQKLSQAQLGPLLNNKLFKWDDAIVYKVDGTALGKLRTIYTG